MEVGTDYNSQNIHGTKPILQVRLDKAPATSAERGRELRARKRLLKQQNEQQHQRDLINEAIIEADQIEGQSEVITKKTSTEKVRKWRNRNKKSGRSSLQTQPKTAAERMREYRKRKAQRRIESNSSRAAVLSAISKKTNTYNEASLGGEQLTHPGASVQMEDDSTSSGPWSQNEEFMSIKEEPLEEDSNDGEFYKNLVQESISEVEEEHSSAHSIDEKDKNETSGQWMHNLEFVSIKGEPFDLSDNDCESSDNLMQDIVKDENISDNDENCGENNINSDNEGALCDKLLLEKKKEFQLDTKKIACPVCCKSINNSTLKRHLKCHKSEKDFHCFHCSKSFTVKESLDYPMKIHSGRRDVQCSECSRTFMAEKNLSYHIMKNHGAIQNRLVLDKKHICHICNKACKTAAGLTKHTKTHKDDEISAGRYPCSQCDKTFVQLGSIKAHLITHMPRKPDEDNTQSDSPASETRIQISEGISILKRRLQEKKSRVGVRDCYLCFVCNKTFKTIKSLNIHKKVHIPVILKKKLLKKFRCSTCNKEYMQKSSLDAHLISHMRAYEYY